MRRLTSLLSCLLALGSLMPMGAAAQSALIGKAALPAVPYWWSPALPQDLEVLPLLWFNTVDGNDEGCCVVGAALRRDFGAARLWLGLGLGTAPDAGTPSAFEAVAQFERGLIAFRELHGRGAVSAQYSVLSSQGETPAETDRLAVGISAVWLDDERYLTTVPLFACPDAAPSVPCVQLETPYAWSRGEDVAVVAEAERGSGAWRSPRLRASLAAGLKLAGGDHDYLRGELEARVGGFWRRSDWSLRLAGGWSSGDAPHQRRFLLAGADPVTRWLNPYLDARGALFSDLPFVGGDIPYFVPGGPNLRSYEETRPLVKRYVAASGELGRTVESRRGFWGRLSAFFEVAWLPGLPDRLGPESLRDNGALLFDWRELPAGEDNELGRFRARSLEVASLWSDFGAAFTGGYDRIAVMVSVPFWASESGFAGEPLSGPKRALALRWTLTVMFTAGDPAVGR